MSRAICVKCGGERTRYDQICPSCGHRPEGEGLLVAWLISDQHLSDEALSRTQARIRAGESIQPTAKAQQIAVLPQQNDTATTNVRRSSQ